MNFTQKNIKNDRKILQVQKVSGKILIEYKYNVEDLASSSNSFIHLNGKFVLVPCNNIEDKFTEEPLLQKRTFSCDFNTQSVCKKTNMIDTKKAVDYLIGLFKNTKVVNGDSVARYLKCSNVKIGKLLTLAAFLYANNPQNMGEKLFDESIISLNCGATINNIDFIILDYNFKDTEDINCEISENNILSEFKINNENQHNILLYVFKKFGGYSQQTLGKYIDAYKPEGINEYDIINAKNISFNSSDTLPEGLDPFNQYIKDYWGSNNETE